MMASLVLTEEKSDCFRLQVLIVDFGTLVLRHTFDQIVQPQPLKDFLKKSRAKLDILWKKKVISNEQWNLLFPQTKDPDSATFDVSLICCLLLNMCGLNSQSHPAGWVPSSMDLSKEADITRIRKMRNDIAHLKNMSITKHHFQISWNEMEQVMLRLGAGIPNLQNDILTLRDKSIDPAKENEYQKIMKEWEETDMIIQKHIDEINSKLEKTGEDIDKVKQDIENANQRSTELCNTVAIYERKIETIENKQIEEATRIDQLDDESLEQRTQLSVMESKQTKLEQALKDTSKTVTKMAKNKLSPRLQSLATITEIYTEDCARDDVYVETMAHKKAKEILLKTGCVILIGPPGEGKTTMATKLLFETSQKGSCLKLTLPTDWDNIDINKRMFDTIFIDDIFGAGALDENLLNEWSLRCKDIEKALQARMIRIIITSRHYIYFEAQMKIRKCTLFNEKNIQLLASFNLTDSERTDIIKKHVQKAERILSSTEIKRCSQAYENAFASSRNECKLPFDLGLYLQTEGRIKAMIGFPEIVSLFSNGDDLFKWGSYFFSKPALFFKKCIEELFVDEEKFLILILIWARPDKKLHLTSIQPNNISREIKQIALKFGIDLKGHIVRVLLKSVKYHKSGFIQFDESTGCCSFTHTTIRDMVGLVAGHDYPNAVVEFADMGFIMEYVTTENSKNDGYHIFVHEYQYFDLLKAICKHMNVKRQNAFLSIVAKKRDYEIRNNFGPVCIDFSLPGELNIDTSVLKHDCFNQLPFVEMFCESKEGKFFMSKPVDILPVICLDWNCDINLGGIIPVYLPTLALLYKHKFLLNVYFEKALHLVINESLFIRTSLLVASHQGMKDVIELLLKHGAVVCAEAVYFAAAKGHVESLACLLENREQIRVTYPNSLNKNSPLIAAAKCGSTKCIELLLRNGADINFRNKNNWSALDKAILNHQTEACKMLLVHNAQVNCKAGKYKRTPLHISADKGDKDITELLLKYGASITAKDFRGHYPIHCAVLTKFPCIKVVEMLLNADVSRKTLTRRISYGIKSAIKGADMFHVAVYKADCRLVDLLLKHNLNPNIQDFYGQTPFYRVIADCHQETKSSNEVSGDSFDGILKEVMDVIFKVRPVKMKFGKWSSMQIIKRLLPIADVTTPDRHGYTPLHAAVHKGLTEVVKLLCPKVNINAQDKYGKTPLHTACEQLDLEIFTILVKDFKADYRMLTKSGQSIFDILQKRTSWKNICRRYRDKKPVKSYMLEKPPFKSFRDVIAAKDPEFASRGSENDKLNSV